MKRAYLLVESRSDQEGPDVTALLRMAVALRGGGHDVHLFLIQNGVLMAGREPLVEGLVRLGVPVLVDDQSSTARGIDAARLGPGVAFAGADDLVRLAMAPGVVTVWH